MKKGSLILLLLVLMPLSIMSQATENRLVREDRIWRSEVGMFSHYVDLDGIGTWEQWFEGTRIINGKTYHDLHLKADYGSDKFQKEVVLAYMREENGQVFTISAGDIDVNDKFYICSDSGLENTEIEAMVYDFNLGVGGSLSMFESQEVCEENTYNPTSNVRYVTEHSITEGDYGFSAETWKFKSYWANFMVYDLLGDPDVPICYPGTRIMTENGEYRYAHYVELLNKETGELLFKWGRKAGVKDVKIEDLIIEGGHLQIAGADDNCLVSVYTLSGSLVMQVDGISCESVDLTTLPQGCYIVRVSTPTGTSVHKVIL